MSNVISKKKYDQYKNDDTFAIVTFDLKTNKRHSTYGGLSIIKAVEEMRHYNPELIRVLICKNLPSGFIADDIKDYYHYANCI